MPSATENQSQTATKPVLSGDRRRPRRLVAVSPQLIPLLRNPIGDGLPPKDGAVAKGVKIPTPERQIMDYLAARKGRPFCDDCLTPHVVHAKPADIAVAIKAIGGAMGFRHVTEACAGCRQTRAGIKAR